MQDSASTPAGAVVAASGEVRVEVVEPPLWQRLAVGSPLHSSILTRLVQRSTAAESHIAQRYDDWIEVDQHLRLFIDLSRTAKQGDKTPSPDGKREMPFGRSVSMPVTYATLWTRTLILSQILGQRDPQLQGTGPEDVAGARLVEAGLLYDLDQSQHSLNQFQACFDAERYGTCCWYDSWFEERGRLQERPIDRIAPARRAMFQQMLPPWAIEALRTPTTREGIRRQFTKVETLDPFCLLPDPRVSIARLQEGEWFGHWMYKAFSSLWSGRRELGGPYFNLDRARTVPTTRQDQAAGRQTTGSFDSGLALGLESTDPGFMRARTMQIRLVPRWWQLSDSEDLEIWWFTWVGEGGDVIVRCHPSAYNDVHGQFTYSIGQSNPDLHAPFTPGSGELIDGIQRAVNFSVNSHLLNVMTSLYNMVITDPTLVETANLRSPGPGKIINLTSEGRKLVKMGHPIGSFLQQMAVMDTTAGNMSLATELFGWGQRMLAANDTLAGMRTPGDRTKGEIEAAMGSASQRLVKIGQLLDGMLQRPTVLRMVQNLLAFRTKAQWFRIRGDLAKQIGAEQVFVRPEDLWGNYDYRTLSPTMPADPARFADTWLELIKAGANVPGLLQPGPDGKILNTRAIVEQIAQNLGINYLDNFFIKVVPDEQVAAAEQAGNMVPLPAAQSAAMVPGMRMPMQGAPALPAGPGGAR